MAAVSTRRVNLPSRGGPLPRDPRGSTSLAGGVIDPNWHPPKPPTAPPPAPPPPTPPPYQPPPAPPAPPVYRPPIAPTAPTTAPPGRDPRIEALLKALGGKTTVQPLDLSATTARSEGLQALLQQLMRGEGIAIGDQSNDPAARAYAIQKRREAERMRESEAARHGASGGADAGGFDARVAQIGEQTGESIAANLADITNKRKGEALQTAITGANLQMSDLDRETRGKQLEYQSRFDAERLKREGTQTLLQALLAQDAASRGDYQRDIDRGREDAARETDYQRLQSDQQRGDAREDTARETDYQRRLTEQRFQEQREAETRRIREEMARLELERARREEEDRKRQTGGGGRWRGGVIAPGWRGY